MNKEDLVIYDNLWEDIKDYAQAMYVSGSQTIDLENCRDKDCGVICKGLDNVRNILKVVDPKYYSKMDIYIEDTGADRLLRDGDFQKTFANQKGWAYGDTSLVNSHILDVDRHLYEKVLIEKYLTRPIESKGMYIILAGLYILKNNEFKFNDEQKQNIQLVHDNKITEELKKYIKDEITRLEEKIYD